MGILLSNEALVITIDLSLKQQVLIVDEYWGTNYDGRPHMDVTSKMMYDWIEDRYNCTIKVLAPHAMSMTFKNDKDLTFFLLNHS